MPEWPPIAEQELLDRLAMDDAQFAEYIGAFIRQLPSCTCDVDAFARACGYPWERPAGSYLLTDVGVELFAEMSGGERERALERFSGAGSGRVPLLAIGSNAAPETLVRKFAYFPEVDDRAVLALTGRLHEFDVGVSAHPALYGAMPATLLPSAGTAVRATLLWVTPAQFTQLTWSELSYRLGRLRTRFAVDDEADLSFGEVLVFVSRWGAFCPAGEPVALAAIPADGRSAPALTQEQVLDAAAALALGPHASAETLVRAVYEDFAGIAPALAQTVHKASLPFSSERWTPFGAA